MQVAYSFFVFVFLGGVICAEVRSADEPITRGELDTYVRELVKELVAKELIMYKETGPLKALWEPVTFFDGKSVQNAEASKSAPSPVLSESIERVIDIASLPHSEQVVANPQKQAAAERIPDTCPISQPQNSSMLPTERINAFCHSLMANPERQRAELVKLYENAPHLGNFKDTVTQLYLKQEGSVYKRFKLPEETYLTRLGGGQDSIAYKVSSARDRTETGVKKGQVLALRVAANETELEKESVIATLRNFSRVQYLNKHCINFYPEFFGEFKVFLHEWPHITHERRPLSTVVHCQEMELIDGMTMMDFYRLPKNPSWVSFDPSRKMISDTVVFELVLGEWASAYFAGVGNDDSKGANFMITNCPYARRYVIEGHSFYINDTSMPKRIDVGGAGYCKESPEILIRSFTSAIRDLVSLRVSPAAEQFLADIKNPNSGSVIEAFAKFYAKFGGSQDNREQVREYIWPKIDGKTNVLPKYIHKD